jgi:small subunit ribosomal protein S3
MGQKVNPFAIRLGITRDWVSKWYANKKQFPIQVHTDFRVREFLKKKLADAHVQGALRRQESGGFGLIWKPLQN